MGTVHGNPLILGHAVGGSRLPIRLSAEQRSKHQGLFGATGSGKSRYIESLLRQDILAWPRTRCGLLLLDPHGEVFDRVMHWVAANDLRRLPIVPIDLRRTDSIIAYNPLRRRAEGEPAVIVGGLLRAILHAWGQSSSSDTPRLAKWLRVNLATLYANGYTLAEFRQMVADPVFRRRAAAVVEDAASRMVWDASRQLKEAEFQEQVESTVNRMMKFLSSRAMRATLCQDGPSLDFGHAIEAGSIVLVSLATEGAQIDEEDANTFGSMILSGLWTAAKTRGKRAGLKSYYVYIDEFQNFVTPTMAKTPNEARGFWLHFLLTAQYPTQLLHRGDIGREVYDAVMASTRTKVVFQMDHPDDLPILAQWLFRGQFDVDEVKHQHYSTKVLRHAVTYLPSFTSGTTRTDGGGTSRSHSASRGGGGSSTTTRGRSSGSTVNAHGEPVGIGESETESDSDSTNWTESESEANGRDTSWSEAASQGQSWSPMSTAIMGREAGAPQFRPLDEQLFRAEQILAAQPQRHAVVRVDGGATTAMETLRVADLPTPPAWVETFSRRARGSAPVWPCR